jgi:signal transduction histidine kinase
MHELNATVSTVVMPKGINIPANYKMQTPGLCVLVDMATKRIVYFDEKFTQTFGYTMEQVNEPGFSLTSIIDETQMGRLHIQIQESHENKLNRFIAYHIKNGDESLVSSYVYVYIPQEPGMKGIVQLCILPEFSKKEAPFISTDTRELFLDLFISLDYGTFEWIIPSNKIFWSEGIYKIYEIEGPKENFDHSFVRQFTHPDDKERVGMKIREAISARTGYDIELKIITRSGNEKMIHAIGRVVLGMDGEPLKLIGSVRDVTKQRAIENSLEAKVAELNKSNTELEEFAYIASHDLQEPLRKISTFSDRLADKYTDILPEDGKMYLQRITSSADNMRALIHNLLEFSRVSKTNEPFMPVSLDIVIREVMNDFELLIDETGTKIQTAELPKVFSSVALMKQLFCNLINNAIKFRKKGTPVEISITSLPVTAIQKRTYCLDLDKAYVDISIHDNGIGFDNEYAGKIFQIFQRLHGKSDYPGSGIGLAICKKIVEKHNGHIYAKGTEGEGAVFHIILPLPV